MKYDDPESEAQYDYWLETLQQETGSLKIATLSGAMRSKLTSIVASAQMLSGDLGSMEDTAPEQELAEIILDAARSISVILDAATEAEAKHSSQ